MILFSAITASAQLIEVSPATVSVIKQATGRDSNELTSFASDKHLNGTLQLPVVHKTVSEFTESEPVFVSQDALNLKPRHAASRNIENVLDLSVLREVSAYRQADRIKIKVSDVQATGIQSGLAELAAAYREPGQASDSADCPSVAISVEQRIKLDPSAVLEIVESEISANPSCACEIVKTAIQASGADVSQVGYITEVAITSAPQSMRMISQCAIAAKPEALTAVQAILAKLDPNSGDTYSSKSSKSGKDAKAAIVTPPPVPPNPLDRIVPYIPPYFPPYFPPPEVTNPDPKTAGL